MRIIYLSQARLPSASANSVHVTKMCSALAEDGHEVTLLGYRGDQPSKIHDYYGTSNNYNIKTFNIDEKSGESVWLAWRCFLYVLPYRNKIELLYSRSAICLFACLVLNIPFIFEIHSSPRTPWHRFMEKRILNSKNRVKCVVISQQLKDWYVKRLPKLAENDVVVLPDASDPFDSETTPAVLRGTASKHIGYIGHLYPGKGGELIVTIAQQLSDFAFHIVGGRPEDIDRLKSGSIPSNLHFYGHKPYAETKAYLKAFDFVLAPYSRQVNLATTDVDIGQWMSPLKLFEYMSAGKAIIASDLPVLKEVLIHKENCILAQADSAQDWANKIINLAKDPKLTQQIQTRALKDFNTKYTWQIRARAISGVCRTARDV